MLYNILLIFQIVVSVSIIGLVLIQHGKGADAGAAFGGGGGASGSVFGSRGSGNFLSRTTGVLAAIFFANSLGLAWMVANEPEKTSLVDNIVTTTEKAAEPAKPTATATEKAPEATQPPTQADQIPDDSPANTDAAAPADTTSSAPADDIPADTGEAATPAPAASDQAGSSDIPE